MEFSSINPYNLEVIGKHLGLSSVELNDKIEKGAKAFQTWRKTSLAERVRLLTRAGDLLRKNTEVYARMITLEMGKPIQESRAEVNKCAWGCDYYAAHSTSFLADEHIPTDAQQSFVRHDPLGTILAIMPWNFPFWQVFRFAAPALTAGNTGLLKHAANVFGCATLIEEIFTQAGYPEGVFQNLLIHHDLVEPILAHPSVQGVSLTGSERAGSAVASLAGKYLKKSLLELGGNNAFIVWKDADLDKAVETAIVARMLNTGQSCIAAKRFILVEDIYDAFVEKFILALKKLRSGNPQEETTQVGPLARKDLADNLQKQMKASIALGAELLHGGGQNGCYHEPTVLGGVTPEMPAFTEETFGPLAAMIKVKDEAEAFRYADNTRYGLGVTVCTRDIERAVSLAGEVSDGAFFVNELVKSDPRLPFGGTRISGYGRELSKDGMMEFVNRKTIFVK